MSFALLPTLVARCGLGHSVAAAVALLGAAWLLFFRPPRCQWWDRPNAERPRMVALAARAASADSPGEEVFKVFNSVCKSVRATDGKRS